MDSGQLLALLPLFLAALVPASLVVAAFLVARQRARFLTVAVFVTSLTAGLTYRIRCLRMTTATFNGSLDETWAV